MEKEFWKEAWDEDRIGFHQSSYNPIMMKTFANIDLKNKNILIPLAGRSQDIDYFLEREANVYAVEIVEKAIVDYFKITQKSYENESYENYTLYKHKNLKFYSADFFNSPDFIDSEVDYVYDRASNIALPKQLRETYYKTIQKLSNKSTKYFILTYTHDGDKDFGPPFYVPEEEILRAYSDMSVELKSYTLKTTRDIQERFQESGITEMTRVLWTNIINPL